MGWWLAYLAESAVDRSLDSSSARRWQIIPAPTALAWSSRPNGNGILATNDPEATNPLVSNPRMARSGTGRTVLSEPGSAPAFPCASSRRDDLEFRTGSRRSLAMPGHCGFLCASIARSRRDECHRQRSRTATWPLDSGVPP